MILIRGIKLKPGEGERELEREVCSRLRTDRKNIKQLKIIKKSLDARKKDCIRYVYSLAVELKKGEKEKLAGNRELTEYAAPEYNIPSVTPGGNRPVVVGFGPGGIFAALVLAKAGAKPIVLERGPEVEERKRRVENFRSGGVLEENANVQFGEGGAGAFSDGKLNTGISDGRLWWVLEQFRLHGAPDSIVYDAKPHVGTDILTGVIKAIREEIVSLGGELRFDSRMDKLLISDGKLQGLQVSGPAGEYFLPAERAILAPGHSARDSFEMLNSLGVTMERKPFSMGVRIEQLQRNINIAQYGYPGEDLPAADFSLNVHLPEGDSAYTFCMCPGGEVIAAASENGGVVTNGMSYSGRAGENANAALLVTLTPEDYPGEGVLAGMYWQREIERAAYRYGGGNYLAPAQRVGDFLENRPSAEQSGTEGVKPSYRPGVVWGDIRQVLPEKICRVLAEAIPEMGKRLKGFDNPEGILTAPETRSSSPVRIIRGSSLESVCVAGLYPCGEGAGYAGGISSAAVDGMRCAEAVLKALGAEI